MNVKFSKDELAMVYQYAAATKQETLAGLREIVPVIRDRQAREIVESTIEAEGKPIEVGCQFCDKKYSFTPNDIKNLIKSIQSR